MESSASPCGAVDIASKTGLQTSVQAAVFLAGSQSSQRAAELAASGASKSPPMEHPGVQLPPLQTLAGGQFPAPVTSVHAETLVPGAQTAQPLAKGRRRQRGRGASPRRS